MGAMQIGGAATSKCVYTLGLKRNAPWKVAFLFRKSVDR